MIRTDKHGLVLRRVCHREDSTFGVLLRRSYPVCVTLELPWRENKRGVSCVPAGAYKLTRHHSERFPNTWGLHNVPGRDAILIHVGNTPRDTEGCILVGTSFGTLDGLPAVLGSKGAMITLNGLLVDVDETTITIQD